MRCGRVTSTSGVPVTERGREGGREGGREEREGERGERERETQKQTQTRTDTHTNTDVPKVTYKSKGRAGIGSSKSY